GHARLAPESARRRAWRPSHRRGSTPGRRGLAPSCPALSGPRRNAYRLMPPRFPASERFAANSLGGESFASLKSARIRARLDRGSALSPEGRPVALEDVQTFPSTDHPITLRITRITRTSTVKTR